MNEPQVRTPWYLWPFVVVLGLIFAFIAISVIYAMLADQWSGFLSGPLMLFIGTPIAVLLAIFGIHVGDKVLGVVVLATFLVVFGAIPNAFPHQKR